MARRAGARTGQAFWLAAIVVALCPLSVAPKKSSPGFLRVAMVKGTTWRESAHGLEAVKRALKHEVGEATGEWAKWRLSALKRSATWHFNVSDGRSPAGPPLPPETHRELLLGTDNPGVLLIFNYRAHWWSLGNFPSRAFGTPNPRGLRPLRLNASLADAGLTNGQAGRIGLFRKVQTNVAVLRYAKEVLNYTVVLFDGQGAGCQTPSSPSGHASSMIVPGFNDGPLLSASGCSCDPEMLSVYAEPVDVVFRHYHCPRLAELLAPVPVVLAPLGVHWTHHMRGTLTPWVAGATVRPLSARKFPFTFLGSLTDQTRVQMAHFLRRLVAQPGVKCGNAAVGAWGVGRGATSSAEMVAKQCASANETYHQKLLDTIFCPAPRGVKMESFRMWEALESGCIVVLDDGGHHFQHEFPGIHDHAIVTNQSWNTTDGGGDLARTIADLLADPEVLDARQRRVLLWYTLHTVWLRRKITTTLRRVLPVLKDI
jgi:hypothetical protein